MTHYTYTKAFIKHLKGNKQNKNLCCQIVTGNWQHKFLTMVHKFLFFSPIVLMLETLYGSCSLLTALNHPN